MVYGFFQEIDDEFENAGANCNRCNHELICEVCESEMELNVSHRMSGLIEERNFLYEIARGLAHNVFIEDGELVGFNADWLDVWVKTFNKYQEDNES